MSEILDICLSDIPREEIREGKNGKKYIKLLVSERREPDNWGNNLCVKISVPKERKDERPIYVGGGKTLEPKKTYGYKGELGDGRGPVEDKSGHIDPNDLPW